MTFCGSVISFVNVEFIEMFEVICIEDKGEENELPEPPIGREKEFCLESNDFIIACGKEWGRSTPERN